MRANAPQFPGGGWAQLELTDAFFNTETVSFLLLLSMAGMEIAGEMDWIFRVIKSFSILLYFIIFFYIILYIHLIGWFYR